MRVSQAPNRQAAEKCRQSGDTPCQVAFLWGHEGRCSTTSPTGPGRGHPVGVHLRSVDTWWVVFPDAISVLRLRYREKTGPIQSFDSIVTIFNFPGTLILEDERLSEASPGDQTLPLLLGHSFMSQAPTCCSGCMPQATGHAAGGALGTVETGRACKLSTHRPQQFTGPRSTHPFCRE